MKPDLEKKFQEVKDLFVNVEQAVQKYSCQLDDEIFFQKINWILHSIEETLSIEEINHNFENVIGEYLNNLKESVLSHFDINGFLNHFDSFNETQRVNIHQQIVRWALDKNTFFSTLYSNFEFIKKVKYFKTNIVAIGANGSGKSTLSKKFKEFFLNNGVVVSAQKILYVPTFNSIFSSTQTASELKSFQQRDKLNKEEGDVGSLQQEFGVILKNLVSENITESTSYRKSNLNKQKMGENLGYATQTNLDKALAIWNSLITHRELIERDGMNFLVNSPCDTYPALQMSDGEKVILFQIAQVLQAPRDGFIVVDEPEMFLHKSIIYKLWDTLESERQDCLFIYLTHDLDFAVSRTNAKKLWIKSFFHPHTWDIQELPENEIPDQLLYEILGSRKKILFCESDKGKNDQKLLSILFPELTVVPVGSCKNVINYTKAYNKIDSKSTSAIGLIDADFHELDRLLSLKHKKIYSYKFAEYENLLLEESFLIEFGSSIGLSGDVNEAIASIKKKVISNLESGKESQTALFVSAKINNFFEASHVSKSSSEKAIESNFNDFIDKVKYKDWYSERLTLIESIVKEKDYKRAISVFNFKGDLHKICNEEFKITDFTDRAISFLQKNVDSHEKILSNFPEEILKHSVNQKIKILPVKELEIE